MRWAFWRRTNKQPSVQQPAEVTSCWPAAPAADDPEDRERHEAFSGAQPAAPADLVPGAPRSPLEQPPPPHLAAPARTKVVELVSAVTARDAPAVTDLLEPMDDAQLSAAAALALAALGARLATLAGHHGEDVPPGSASWRETVLQADLTSDRGEPSRRAVARHVPAELLRFAVRFACRTPEADPAIARHASAAPGDLLLAAAVVLAQTVEDGAGSVQALNGELQALTDGLQTPDG